MIRIFADSTNDLTKELIDRYGVKIVPLYIRMGEESVRDGLDFDVQSMYNWSDAHKSTPTTAAFSPGDAEDALREAALSGDDVLFFGISSDISSTCNSFRIAAANLEWSDHVFIVDTRSLGNGIGLLIIKAANMIAEGKHTAAEIWLEIEKLIPRVRVSFVVETVKYLYRGGRCSAVSALASSALGIKPKIIMNGGKMTVGAKYRGKPEIVAKKYFADLKKGLLRADKEMVFVYHSVGTSQEVCDILNKEIRDLKYFENVYETVAGGIISSHCGPGTYSIMYLDTED